MRQKMLWMSILKCRDQKGSKSVESDQKLSGQRPLSHFKLHGSQKTRKNIHVFVYKFKFLLHVIDQYYNNSKVTLLRMTHFETNEHFLEVLKAKFDEVS